MPAKKKVPAKKTTLDSAARVRSVLDHPFFRVMVEREKAGLPGSLVCTCWDGADTFHLECEGMDIEGKRCGRNFASVRAVARHVRLCHEEERRTLLAEEKAARRATTRPGVRPVPDPWQITEMQSWLESPRDHATEAEQWLADRHSQIIERTRAFPDRDFVYTSEARCLCEGARMVASDMHRAYRPPV